MPKLPPTWERGRSPRPPRGGKREQLHKNKRNHYILPNQAETSMGSPASTTPAPPTEGPRKPQGIHDGVGRYEPRSTRPYSLSPLPYPLQGMGGGGGQDAATPRTSWARGRDPGSAKSMTPRTGRQPPGGEGTTSDRTRTGNFSPHAQGSEASRKPGDLLRDQKDQGRRGGGFWWNKLLFNRSQNAGPDQTPPYLRGSARAAKLSGESTEDLPRSGAQEEGKFQDKDSRRAEALSLRNTKKAFQ
ncbi:hypothetical protein GWK47_008526 [Chionoecetes opilio]|uniref:Uncharacterized protein n=1 Tax=Chionoecetes opilio TaxID=41210 RepID=A0A8J4XZ24_CHIOP|nr:hypothetical protein GWK47_008526 [Chionoecetes opilio]